MVTLDNRVFSSRCYPGRWCWIVGFPRPERVNHFGLSWIACGVTSSRTEAECKAFNAAIHYSARHSRNYSHLTRS